MGFDIKPMTIDEMTLALDRISRFKFPEDKLKREGYLNPKVVHKIWNDFAKEDGAYQPLIWYILMFEQWLEYDIM